MARASGEPEMPTSPFSVEPGGNRDGLEERRLAASVLTDQEDDWMIQREVGEAPDRRYRIRVYRVIWHPVPMNLDIREATVPLLHGSRLVNAEAGVLVRRSWAHLSVRYA